MVSWTCTAPPEYAAKVRQTTEGSSTIIPPKDWTTGSGTYLDSSTLSYSRMIPEDPMTSKQSAFLHQLADEKHVPLPPDEKITKGEASVKIDELKSGSGGGAEPVSLI